ncbi:MAG: exodeoxyribonuclease VII large subunit [Polyangiaceae bacterium]|nr:exodeoxyribonuclease VII large subunit [Polyangiaceae bacterium]
MSASEEVVYSVFQIAHRLKRTVEDETSGQWLEGEVGRVSRPGSGHIYFSVADTEREAVLDCVMYRRDALRWSKLLLEGEKVQLRGRASLYPARGRLQWIAERARAAGQGDLLEALKLLRARLEKEGLFSAERKRLLPKHVRTLGVVTSRTGAAFHDICRVAQRRGAVQIILSAASVQGEAAPRELVTALDKLARVQGVDAIIIGRGGGSQEDLAAFNDESVVRAVADCPLPIVSAVGHEIDTSLSDLVADARAATPSEAAELLVADARQQSVNLERLQSQLRRAMILQIQRLEVELHERRRQLSDPRFALAESQQGLDEHRSRMARSLARRIRQERIKYTSLQERLLARHPQMVVARGRSRLGPLKVELRENMKRRLAQRRTELGRLARALEVLSPLSSLGRGYAIARDTQGQAIRSTENLKPGEVVHVRVSRGAFLAKVEKVDSLIVKDRAFDHESETIWKNSDHD